MPRPAPVGLASRYLSANYQAQDVHLVGQTPVSSSRDSPSTHSAVFAQSLPHSIVPSLTPPSFRRQLLIVPAPLAPLWIATAILENDIHSACFSHSNPENHKLLTRPRWGETVASAPVGS